jgi:hypothetical protein
VKRRHFYFGGLLLMAALVTSCATQPMPTGGADLPGFWLGFWHGLAMLFSLVASIFTDCRIYAFPNSGGWYDFGFVLGASACFGGGAASARR